MVDSLGDHRVAAVTSSGGLLRCGSDPGAEPEVAAASGPAANDSSIAGTNAARSSGPLLVVRFPSRTTSWSHHLAPALTTSSLIPAQDVTVRPWRTPADASTHGP